MVTGEVSLSRLEKFLFGLPPELRPALTEGDPSMLVFDRSHEWDHAPMTLSIRFQNVAGHRKIARAP